MSPPVLIIGASGAVGRPLVHEFLKQKSQFQRIAVSADPAKVSRFADAQKKGVEVVVGPFLDVSSYKGFDVVLSLAGNAAMKLQPGMIEAAISGGVRHFYPSEFGGDIAVGNFWQNRYFRDKVVTRDHLAAKAKEYPDFRYTLVLTGPFTEYVVSSFNGIDFEKHTVQPYGKPGAELSITAMADVMRYIVGSILIPFDAGKHIREFRVPGQARITWEKLVKLLGEAQGVEYKLAYLDPQEAAAKQEQARKEGNENDEVFWAGKAGMLNGSGLIPEPFDNRKFSFTSESAKETIQRLFGNA
ncbi:hypothetical protein C8F04DRAFT_1135179 [Mycena alexandri]|uniref:NmrA-like domain-containing protein n=1 Tax=Mycena alexandri TaxID=1745969 RepID=A0AAD6SBC3_9AGAR|nr:hypothetical protein C8F04DRAFT_1135179 [Mycena alexandri]